jgi:hypothetical protein
MPNVSAMQNRTPALLVRSGLKAGDRIICYQESNGSLYPVVTPCSTDYYYPVVPQPIITPTVQRLRCQACNGSLTSDGSLANARCEVCYL